MNLVNETPFETGWNVGFQPDGREVVVVVTKATYELRPRNGSEPALAEEQIPPLEADEFGEDPATDAPIHENDFALHKPMCDILLHAQAHSPQGRPVKTVDVGFQVAGCSKSFRVVGRRFWLRTLGAVTITDPIPFVSQEISYDLAYGGTDIDPDKPTKIQTYVCNPVGTGYCPSKKNVDRTPLPVTEEKGNPVKSPKGKYVPMALGPIGRNWDPRYKFAGTYDDKWMEQKLPFLPDDFDYLYFQAAPADQQIPYPRGGEPIVLVNLSAEGQLKSQLPTEGIHVSFINKKGDLTVAEANLDTIVLDPEANRLCLTWRATQPLNRDLFELRKMLVQQSSRYTGGLARAHASGKTHYAGLGDLVKSKNSRS